MIVIIGRVRLRGQGPASTPAGLACGIGLVATSSGRRVELITKIGDDATGDELSLALARARIGHVATLRDAAHATVRLAALDADDVAPELDPPSIDPADVQGAGMDRELNLDAADVELGLRYLTDFAVVVLAEAADPETIAVVADAARWSEARMILVVGAGQAIPAGLPDDVVVFEAPATDPDGAFAGLVGAFASSLDAGTEPGTPFRASIASDGWTEAGGS